MSEPTFRRASTDDVDDVLTIARRIWGELGDRSGFPQEPQPDAFSGLVAGERTGVFVCERDGGVCGFSVLNNDPDNADGAVMGVWLLPEARGQGIGRELALMATDFAREAGYRKLRGTLPPENEPALSFFSEIATLAQVVGRDMEYELPL